MLIKKGHSLFNKPTFSETASEIGLALYDLAKLRFIDNDPTRARVTFDRTRIDPRTGETLFKNDIIIQIVFGFIK